MESGSNLREPIGGLTVEQHLSDHAAAGEALRHKVMRDALSTLETPRAGPSEAAERSRSVGIVLKLQDRHSGARSLDYTFNPARLFPCRGNDNPGESLSESPGTGFLMRLIVL